MQVGYPSPKTVLGSTRVMKYAYRGSLTRVNTYRGILAALLIMLWQTTYAAENSPVPENSEGNQTESGEQTRAQTSLSRFGAMFSENCAVCHGENLRGAAQGTALVGADLIHGDAMDNIVQSITEGYADQGMPAWQATFSTEEIKSMALWISENRNGLLYSEFNISSDLTIPTEVIHTELHDVRIESVIDGLDPLPYSIAPLPDGRILLTEKMRGIRVISANGEKSELVTGTPTVYDDARVGGGGLEYGSGWLLDIAPHPKYNENGWVYLHYTDRCENCNEASKASGRPVSMNALMRGRIRDGRWVDEEIIWQAPIESYTTASDVATGGRIAFDPDGFVFISVGMKSMEGIQDLRSPHGKIHRLHDDGRIPTDNPFIDDPNAGNTIWTYGHRSPQGLEFNKVSRQLWGTEHGPRGGDEINLLLPGRNYGWPLYSKGQNYNGTEVAWGKEFGIEVELKDIQQPVVDLTPSPAISSFVFYSGDAFPAWRDNIIVGSLKAADLYRIEIKDNKMVHRELVIDNLARIRDVEVDLNGAIYLLLEHDTGGQIVRLLPAETLSLRAN